MQSLRGIDALEKAVTAASDDPVARRLLASRRIGDLDARSLVAHQLAAIEAIPDSELLADNVQLLFVYNVLLALMYAEGRRASLAHQARFWKCGRMLRDLLECGDTEPVIPGDDRSGPSPADRSEKGHGHGQRHPAFRVGPNVLRTYDEWPAWRKGMWTTVATNQLSAAQCLGGPLPHKDIDLWLRIFALVESDPQVSRSLKDRMAIVAGFMLSAARHPALDDVVPKFTAAVGGLHRPKSVRAYILNPRSALYHDDYGELEALRRRLLQRN